MQRHSVAYRARPACTDAFVAITGAERYANDEENREAADA
jgi:hypothetical protein